MRYIVNSSNDPAFNIALEEYCFKNLTKFEEIFILWINEPCIVLGKHQNAIEEINADYVKENNIHVVRRISGGGAVYHDLNNLNYTIISSKTGNEAFDFKTFSTPVIKTLEKLGVIANFTGRNDIEIDGKKICGNAQAYYKGRMMHHGCLLFDVDLTVLSKALNVSKDKIESKGIKSVRSRVTNILNELENKIDIHEFSRLLMEQMKQDYADFEEYILSEKELEIIKQNRAIKHANWDWVYGKSPDYNIRRDTKFDSGKLSVYVDVHESKIRDIKIYGDFFGIEDVYDIEDLLRGVKYTENDILKALENVDISRYFLGIDKKQIANAICNM